MSDDEILAELDRQTDWPAAASALARIHACCHVLDRLGRRDNRAEDK